MAIQFNSTSPVMHQRILDGSARAAYNGEICKFENRIGSRNGHIATWEKYFTTVDRNSFPLLDQAMTQKENAVSRFLTGRGGPGATADITNAIENVFHTVLKINITKGVITPDDHDAKERIINHTHHMMRLHMSNNVLDTHNAEGQAIARQHGLRPWEPHVLFRDWVHYDSDFYFMEKELVSILNNVADGLYRNIGIEVPDFEAQWRDVFGGAHNFHTRWHMHSASTSYHFPERTLKNTSLGGWMLDVRTSPPKGFSFFFAETNITKEVRDPVSNQHITLTIQQRIMFFNKQFMMREGQFENGILNLFNFWDRNISNDNSMMQFLKNFEIWKNIFNTPNDAQEINPYWQSQFKGGQFAGAV